MFESSFSSLYKENIELDANFDTSEILNSPHKEKEIQLHKLSNQELE